MSLEHEPDRRRTVSRRAFEPREVGATDRDRAGIGGVHIVQFGNTTKEVKAYPFDGTFRDFVIWPADSRGIPLTFRLTVKSGPTKKVIGYHVTPH